MEERSRRRRMRSRFFFLFGGGGGGSGGVTSTTSTASAARAVRRTERVAAGAAGARDICLIRACGNLGLGLVALAEGTHAAHRAAALAAGVREDVLLLLLRGRARELRGVEVGVSAQFGGAEVR